ncbi:YfhO family protein [Gracilimonas tropica]|uniref:YfhO family protein n=1 Tax=Gracilimonas tropica TaxID=454600 RepID=UPI00036A58D2|nr:YfhO family protein [Gracilimonas tropica]
MSKQPSTATGDFFTNMPDARQHLIALAILFLIPFFLFTATTIGGKELQRHDTTQWRAAAESVIEYRETYDREPLWVTNMFGGMPAFVVSVKTVVPHIDRIKGIFSNIYPAFQYWVLLSGVYFLLVLIGFQSLVSVFGSLMFSLTTYIPIIIIAGHNSKFESLAIIPWLIAGYWLISHHKKKLSGFLLFSVALTLELRAGHPQITYYFYYLLGILWVFDGWKSYQEKSIKDWGITTALLISGTILGVLGYAEKLFAMQEYASYSLRGGSNLSGTTGLTTDYAFAWSQGIWETITLIIPGYFGGASPEYWGPKSFTSGPHYLGALSLPFILIALLRDRRRIVYAFFTAGTLGIFFAWGENFRLLNEFAFDYIPYFDKFRAPETWLVFTAFCYTVVAVFGLNWFVNFISQKNKELKQLYLPIGISVGVIVLLFIQVNSADFTRPGEVQNIANQIAQQNQVQPTNPQVQQRAQSYVNAQLVPAREEKAKSDVLRFAIIIVIATGLIYLTFTGKIPVSAGLFGFILIVAVDMIAVDKRYIPEDSIVSGNVNAETILESQRRDIDTWIQEHISENSTYPYRVLPLLRDPYSSSTPAYFYPVIGGYSASKLSVIQDVMYGNGPLNIQSQNFNPELLNLMNVKYVTYSQPLPLPGFTQVFRGEQGLVFENQNVFPKAFFVDSVITTQEPAQAYNYLMPGQLNFANTAVVETSDQLVTSSDTTSNVAVTEYTGPEITLEVSRSEPGFLVLSETYYPAGWTATLDGEEILIYKTNYFQRGLQIPAGEHTVKLHFMPETYRIGVILAWGALIVQVLIFLYWGFRRFRNRMSGDT